VAAPSTSSASPASPASPGPGLAWSWDDAALGAAYALPAAIVALSDPAHGLALSVGVLPASILGLMPRRRGRLMVIAAGALTGVPMFLGGLLAGVPVLAVIAIAALAIGAVALARARPAIGRIAMVLALPMVGVGLSYSDVGEAAGLAGLMVLGSIYACAVSMPWPERPAAPRPGGPPPSREYGLRLAAAGASAAALGFVFGLEHVGWATAAALLVMRPAAEMQRLRSVGRLVAVAVGGAAAVVLVHLAPADGWYALAIVVTMAAAAATHRSRWYATPAFTTFLVFLLLLHSDPGDSRYRFDERLLETAIGVALAYLFGLALPALRSRRAPANG
jgi:hypothetical protein